MLVRAIRSGADALPEHRFLEPRLLLRKTTRPLPTYKPYPADKLKRPGRT